MAKSTGGAAGGAGGERRVVLVGRRGPVRRQALDGEGTCDADAGLVLVGAVVEVLDVGLAGDGGVDAALALDAGGPPGGVRLPSLGRPGWIGVAWDLPFLPGLAQGGIQRGAQGFQRGLRFLPQHVDLGIVGDGFQGDVRGAFVHEAVAHVVADGGVARGLAGDGLFFGAALAAVGEQVVGVFCRHEPGAREGEGDAGRVDGDPAAAPLLGDGGGGAGAAGRVQHEVARVGGHKDAALDNSLICLNNVNLVLGTCQIFSPEIRDFR